jgi:competence protein ComEC
MNEPDSPTEIEATFIDVGHGTAVILRFSPSDVWLYDCGRLGISVGSCADIDTALWSLGATQLSGVLISHSDIDHYNALPGLLKRFDVGAVYTPASVFEDQDQLLQEIKSQIDALQIPIVHLHTGMKLQTSGITLDVLHPPSQRIQGSDNANSLVLAAHAGSSPLVLPGDLEPPGTQELLWQPRVRGGGVLMAPHHGSLQLDMRPILDWSRASSVIVSGGDRAAREEVQVSLSATGAGVFVTSELGAIRVRIVKNGDVRIQSWLESAW